jgi:hypothetical protein
MRLYKKFSRFKFKRMISRSLEKRLLWALNLNPGDLVYDCSAFNVVVRDIQPLALFNGRGYAIHDIEIIHEPFGGSCSVVHCGVGKPKSRHEIEKNYLIFLRYWLSNPNGAAKWYSGLDNPEFQDEINVWKQMLAKLENNEHICDERGVKIVNS